MEEMGVKARLTANYKEQKDTFLLGKLLQGLEISKTFYYPCGSVFAWCQMFVNDE
jgi:hypothetical protein